MTQTIFDQYIALNHMPSLKQYALLFLLHSSPLFAAIPPSLSDSFFTFNLSIYSRREGDGIHSSRIYSTVETQIMEEHVVFVFYLIYLGKYSIPFISALALHQSKYYSFPQYSLMYEIDANIFRTSLPREKQTQLRSFVT